MRYFRTNSLIYLRSSKLLGVYPIVYILIHIWLHELPHIQVQMIADYHPLHHKGHSNGIVGRIAGNKMVIGSENVIRTASCKYAPDLDFIIVCGLNKMLNGHRSSPTLRIAHQENFIVRHFYSCSLKEWANSQIHIQHVDSSQVHHQIRMHPVSRNAIP